MSVTSIVAADEVELTEAPASPVDVVAAQRAAADLLVAIGADPDSESLRDTPRRIAAAYAELLNARPFTPTSFPNDSDYSGPVVVSGIPFTSLCEHHLLPFIGQATVGYLPGARLLGLSKLAHVVEHFARRLQVQERMTAQIAHWLDDELAPEGVGVIVSAEHSCMTMRGAKARGATTTTSMFLGQLRDDPAARAAFREAVGTVTA
ncbi:MAG TPA: GTP cyclohydrolase I [Mycobacteriales bacterium]|nr:GTP cyclohydrolase I [Mycobacteriales bacterium]